jgi:hypothetical protein
MSGIFISHNHKDKAFVRRLAAALQKKGVRVWVDEAEMKVGDLLIDKIQEAIDQMEYLGVVLSNNSIKSEWVTREVNQALNSEIGYRRVKVLPILLDDCEVLGFLRGKLYADFRNEAQFEIAMAALLNRLLSSELDVNKDNRQFDKPTLAIEYNGEISNGDEDLRLFVMEVLENIKTGTTPPFQVSLSQDVLGNTSRDIDTALLLGPRNSLQLYERLHELDTKLTLSISEREERLRIKSILNSVSPHTRKFINSTLAILTEDRLEASGVLSRPEDKAQCIRGISRSIFGKHKRQPGDTRIDIYRVWEPQLGTSIFLSHEELESLLKIMGMPIMALTIKTGWNIFEIPPEPLRDKAIPAIVVEVYTVENKIDTYEPRNEFLNLSEWFIGLG